MWNICMYGNIFVLSVKETYIYEEYKKQWKWNKIIVRIIHFKIYGFY